MVDFIRRLLLRLARDCFNWQPKYRRFTAALFTCPEDGGRRIFPLGFEPADFRRDETRTLVATARTRVSMRRLTVPATCAFNFLVMSLKVDGWETLRNDVPAACFTEVAADMMLIAPYGTHFELTVRRIS